MGTKKQIRIKLTGKMLILTIGVVLTASFTIGAIGYKAAAKGITKSVYGQIDAISETVVQKIVDINERHFQTLHSLAELSFMKDETISLTDKQKQLVNVAAAIGENISNMAFYDAEGNAIVADGRYMNFAARPYFKEAFAGKDFVFEAYKQAIKERYRFFSYGDCMLIE